MDEREKLQYKNASTSQHSHDSLKMEITEEGNWTNVKTIHQNDLNAHSSTIDKNDKDAIMSYSTNREKVYHKNTGTIEEIHVLESSGRTTRDFSEEHWSSEIKSYVMPEPPKFMQVIKAFRVLATDTLTLVVEVQSDPPAIFEWFCNDRPVQQNRRKFKARHGINITTLTVEGPEQGVYKCTARNPVGISTTYGYVTVNAPPSYKTWLEQTHEVNEETRMEIIDKENLQITTDMPPKFIQQIPNLTLRPGTEALIDVEVEASPPAKFTWYVNGVQFCDTVKQIEIYYPMANRCIARFPIPQKGEYKVTAENRAGKEHSIGYIDIKNEVMYNQTQLPPLPGDHVYHHLSHTESEHREIPLQGRGRASSVSRTVNYYEENSYYQRSTSLPRQIGHPYEIKKATEIIRKRKDVLEELYEFISEIETIPAERPPRVVSPLQPSVLRVGESLKLRCRVDGLPLPEVFWTKDGIRIDDGMAEKELITVQYPDGRYELINPQCAPEDAGLYQLIARNIHGSVNTSAYIHIERQETVKRTTTETRGEIQVIHRAPSKPRFSKVISKQYEQDTVVSCDVISETPVVISWYKDGQRLYSTYKYRMQKLSDNTYTLTICNIDKRDEGSYICRAENTYGISETGIYIRSLAKTQEISEEILIEENASEVIGLQDDIGYAKKKYIDTTVKVLVEPEVSGSQEMYSHTAELRKTEAEYKLLVKVAEIVASKLVAKVIIDEAIDTALKRMDVKGQSSEEEEFESINERHPCPPRFETNVECYTVDVGDTVMLHTDISGYPQPRIEWYFGEHKLEQSEQIEAKYVNEQAILTIKKVEKKHEGTYYCHAENDYGKAVLPCNLCVTDTAHEWSESTYKMTRPPLTYTLSETEAEVSSNVHVTHATESYDHYFSTIQPETFALGYSCLASTSRVHDDSVIITRESMQKMIEREQETTEVILNVNVERTPAVFKHDARILRSIDESVTISRREPRYTRAEEVIQTNNIFLIGDQRVLQQHQSMVNAVATVVFEKPPQRALHEVICLYDEKIYVSKEKVQAVSTVDLKKTEIVSELVSTIMATQGMFREAYAEANVDVRCPDAVFDHFITVVDSEQEYFKVHLVAPVLVRNLATSDFHLQQKPESLHTESVYIEYPRRNATAEQRIVILQSSFQKFSEAITWNLKKVSKEATESDITVAHANIVVYKPEEIGEYATTIVDARKMVPELLAIAAAASKLKLTSVFITFTKKGDVAHQALVIEYESFVEEEATLNVAMLTAPGFHSKQESVWSYGKKYEKSEETEANVVAVFVEVNATCPNQTIELIASVSLPPSAFGITDVTHSLQPPFEPSSVSWSESSSAGLLQMPKFVKTLENMTAIVGQFHQFKCIVTGAPAPMIRWYVDGDVIHDSDIYQTIYEDGVCILKIREVAIEDEGEYTCEATNDAGRVITKCFLQTITEADILKYHQEVTLENILYSNSGSNNNNDNDNCASLDNISSLSNVDGTMYRNHTICDSLVEQNSNRHRRKQFLIVNYEFARNEPICAETAVIVTCYTAPRKGLRKNLALEERSFNISVFLPNAAMECDFIWAFINCETVELHLMSSYQATDFVIQNFLPQQVEEACLLLFVKKLTLENISFAVCQPWEEILLVKKPENAFVWDNEFYRMQKVRVEILIKSSNENGCSKNESMEDITVGVIVDAVGGDDATNFAIQANLTSQMKESINNSEKLTSEHNEKIVCYKDKQEEESRIPIIPQEMTYGEKEADDLDILLRDDDNQFNHESFRQTSEEYLGVSVNALAAIRRCVDELLNFDLSVPTATSTGTSSYKQGNVIRLNTTNNQMGNDLLKDSVNEEYLNCSFCRRLEHVEIIRDFPIPGLTSASSYFAKDISPLGTVHLNSNLSSKNVPSNKERIESTRSLTYEIGYDSGENSGQNLGNPGSKGSHSKLDTCNSFNKLDNIPLYSHHTTETYPLHLTTSIESTETAVTFDPSEEFEVFSASANPRLQHDESYSTSVYTNGYNLCVLEDKHLKPFHVSPGTVDTLTSNTNISAKKDFQRFPLGVITAQNNATVELLSKIKVMDEVCGEDKTEIEVESENNEEVLQIERAIYDISERIEHQHSLTEAQAEASEELLKTILENIIKNTGRSSVIETMAAYKKPVVLLREKLTDLEETLKREDLEFRESSMTRSIPEAQSAFSKSFSAEREYAASTRESSIEREICGASLYGFQQTGSTNKQEIRRMTPLTSNIKEQLQSLECMLEEVEKEGENDIKELSAETHVPFPVYSDAKQHEVHNILVQINNEISIIKRCCQRNISKTSLDAAVGLLHKVRNNVSSMVDLISVYKKRLRKKSPGGKGRNASRERIKSSKRSSHHLSPCSRTGFFFKTDASVNLYFKKREESEVIHAIVKLTSSDKSGNQISKSENSEVSTYEDAVFDDKNKISQEIGNDPMWTLVSESDTEKDDKVILSDFVDPPSSSFSLHSVQDSQTTPVRPPRRLREMHQQRASSPHPVPPLRTKRRSKSCDDYKNLIVRSSSSDARNYPLPMLQNMTANMSEEGETSQLDMSVHENGYLNPLNVINLVDVEESSPSMSEHKSKKFNEREISYEKIIKKKGSFSSCSYVWPSREEYHISLETFDEPNSIQLTCEDSDYAPESVMHSLLLFEPTGKVQEEMLLQTLEVSSDLTTTKVETIAENIMKSEENFVNLKNEREEKKSTTPELDETFHENISKYLVDMDQKTNESLKSLANPQSSTSENAVFESVQKLTQQHSHVSLDTKPQGSAITNTLEDEANSLHEIESIDDKDEMLDELDDLMIICNPHASIIDGIDLLPTIVEDNESSKIAHSFMSVSTNTIIANIDMQETNSDIHEIVGEDEEGSDITSSSTLESTAGLTEKTFQVPFSRSDVDDINYLDNYKQRVILICENDAEQVSEETTINVNYKKPSNKLKVIAVLSPEIQAKAEACTIIGEDFDVLIEQPDEAQDFTVKILDHISDSISLDLTLQNTVEVDLSLKRSEQYGSVLSYQVKNLHDGETDEERISDYEHHHHHHSSKTTEGKEKRTGISVNIIARSMHDFTCASLEEIPWGEVSMYIVMQPIMIRSKTDSETRNSLIQNVTVSESNETEKRSLRSHESFRSSSRQSFDWSEFGDRSISGQNFNIPSYVLKEGSTATITCEFNNFLTPGSFIDWFKGKSLMQIVPGKTDRISHDLLEVLVISHLSLMDGDIYSIRVNDVIYPVAYLIVENADASSEKINDDIHFISPPQTLFVMEGQPSIISCQVGSADAKIQWCKDNKKWVTENERIRLETDHFGYHRIIIDKSELEDQGTYYAFLGDQFTTVTLVVEERIDEREVTISALGTDTDEDDYHEYLVPFGSTATISCELESTDEVQKLVWRKDGKRIEFSDDGKVEHVVNGLKHYLVIHDTQADDSASYSICINDIEFKIAHLTVSSYATGEYASQVTVEESLVPVGSAATIHCETIAQQYSLDWRKNLQPIMEDERIERKDTADGFEHSLTIYSVRKSDEGEYGVLIKDSYTAVTKITVIESQEQIATEHFDISLNPTPAMMSEAFAQLHDRVNLQHAQTFEAYQLCNMEEYFDLRFTMQSFEIPVIVDEKRFVSVSYMSRGLSNEKLEKDINIYREPSYATSSDLTFMEITIIACNFVTTDVHFEFTSSTSVSHAVGEAIVLTLIAQQSAQIHLSSQSAELTTSFIKQSSVEQLTVVTSVREKIVEKLGIKLGDRWVKLDVILLSPMQSIAMNITNKIPRMIAIEMKLFALIFEKYDKIITFDRTSECEYYDAVLLTKSVIYPEKITRKFAVDVVWLEFIAVYKVPQVFDTTIRIDLVQKEMFHLQCNASEAHKVDEVFTVCSPIQQQDIAVTFLETLSVATSGNYVDSISSLEIMLSSDMDQDLFISKEIPLVRMEMIGMKLSASVLEVIPVTYSFSKATQNESMELTIFVKSLMHYETSQRQFVDSVVKLELELWSQINRNFYVITDFRAVEMDRLSARFSSSIEEYFDVSTAFTIQPKMDSVIATLLTKAPKIVRKTSRLFSDDVVNVISECSSQISREFYADAIFLIPRIDVHVANFRATFENLHVISTFEVQSQESSATITLLMRAPTIVERSSSMFFDDLVHETAEFRSQLMRNLEVETEIFTAREDSLIKNIKSAEFEEKNIIAIIEVRPEKEDLEFILLTPVPTLIQEISQSFSDAVVNLITELHMQNDSHIDGDIIIAQTCTTQLYLKASEEENVTVLARFYIQDEIENIVATLLTQAPTIEERNERKFSDSLVNFVIELWSQVCREAFANVEIYIARNDKMQTKLKASFVEDTHISLVLKGYSEAEELDVTLSEIVRTDTYKVNRFFSYQTIDLIAALWYETQANSYADVNISIKRKHSSQICLKAFGEQCTNMLTSFEVKPQVGNVEMILLARVPIVVERTNRTFSSNFTKIISEMFSTVDRNLYAYFEAVTAAYGTTEAWIKAVKEENLDIRICFEVESEACYADAVVLIRQKERQLANVQASFLENIEIYTSFELCSEEEQLLITIRSEKIIEVIEKRYSDNETKLDVEIYYHASNHEIVEAVLMEFKPYRPRRTIEETEMDTLWSRTQLDIGFYQHLDLARSIQISDSAFILHENIYEEDESTDELSTSLAQAAPQFAEILREHYEIEEFASHAFKCIIYGTPAPQVRWYHNGQAITPNDNITEIAEDGIHILKINSADRSWNGSLVCEAENDSGTARTHSTIYVQRSEESSISSASIGGQSPVIHLSLSSEMHVKMGENVQLKCVISGSPMPSVQWKRNDVIIENNEHYLIICDDGICILRISNVAEEDNAIFSCTAMNIFGSTKTESRMIVEDTSSLKEEEILIAKSTVDDHTIDEVSPGSMSSQDSFTTQFQIPQFTLPLHDINICETDELQLKCIVTGEPMPTIHWTYNGKGIKADNRNIFAVYDDGIIMLKIAKGDKKGLYVCEATNGVGSAQTQCFVHTYSPEVSLTTAIELKDMTESAEAVILSVSTSKFCSTADISEKIKEDLEERKLRKEEITTDQYIPTGTLNYLIEAEAQTIRIMSYKLSAYAKVRVKSKKLKEEKLFKIIIDEEVIRTRTYLRVVERSATQFWTQDHTIERPSYWSREVINERVEFEKIFQNDQLDEFLEDKDIIERYVQLLKATETSKSSEERETRFKLRQTEGSPKILQKRQLEVREEQTGRLAEDTGFFAVVHCIANAMSETVEAYVILITRYRYKATFDIRPALYHAIARGDEFEASIEDLVRREKYFPHSVLRLPYFTQSFAIFQEGYDSGLRCSVYGLPAPCIRISHNGCPILRNNRFFHVVYKSGVITLYMQHILEGHYVCEAINEVGRAVIECYIRMEEGWDEKQHRRIRRIRVENVSKTTKSADRRRQDKETAQTSTTQYEYQQSKQISEAMESVENMEYALTENGMKLEDKEEIRKEAKAEEYEEISKNLFIERKPANSAMNVSVTENVYDASEREEYKVPQQEIDAPFNVIKPAFIEHAEILYRTIHHGRVYHETFAVVDVAFNEQKEDIKVINSSKVIEKSMTSVKTKYVEHDRTAITEVTATAKETEDNEEISKEIFFETKSATSFPGSSVIEHIYDTSERVFKELQEQICASINISRHMSIEHAQITRPTTVHETMHHVTIASKTGKEVIKHIKEFENEIIDVSIISVATEAQTSVHLTKEAKTEQPAEAIIEKAVKPEVEEKIERAIEEFEETEITLDCEKHQEHKKIHVSILTVASESAQAS
ncbi:immunoglobulin I-set domain-containing protein, variant, partial [Loa loa]